MLTPPLTIGELVAAGCVLAAAALVTAVSIAAARQRVDQAPTTVDEHADEACEPISLGDGDLAHRSAHARPTPLHSPWIPWDRVHWVHQACAESYWRGFPFVCGDGCHDIVVGERVVDDTAISTLERLRDGLRHLDDDKDLHAAEQQLPPEVLRAARELQDGEGP